MKNSSIKLVDMLGKETDEIDFTGKQLILEKSSMKSGVCFLRIVAEHKNILYKKIIIE